MLLIIDIRYRFLITRNHLMPRTTTNPKSSTINLKIKNIICNLILAIYYKQCETNKFVYEKFNYETSDVASDGLVVDQIYKKRPISNSSHPHFKD